MNSLKSIRSLLIEYLEEASACRSELENMSLICVKEDFQKKVYNVFFNLIADSTQSPETIVNLLDTFTGGLEGFFTNKSLQTLVGFACLEALARRTPEVLDGPWETLVWMIVKYLSFSSAIGNERINHMYFFKESNTETLKLITEFGSPELCPNPCLRLELFRFMRNFRCFKLDYDRESFRDKVINTLFELCDNYTSLTVNQVPNFSPMDLNFVIETNFINIEYITNDSDLDMKRSEIIAAVLKLTRNFALLEKEKYQRVNNQAIEYRSRIFNKQLSACLSFCGLLPDGDFDHDIDHDKCLLYLVQAVGNDSLLQSYVIDTLDTITQISLCFPGNIDLQGIVARKKDKLLYRFFKGHINQLPTFQYMQEIYGGISQSKEYRLRYFQSDCRDLHNYSDYNYEYSASEVSDSEIIDSEENDSEENYSEEIVSEENDSEENYSEEIDSEENNSEGNDSEINISD